MFFLALVLGRGCLRFIRSLCLIIHTRTWIWARKKLNTDNKIPHVQRGRRLCFSEQLILSVLKDHVLLQSITRNLSTLWSWWKHSPPNRLVNSCLNAHLIWINNVSSGKEYKHNITITDTNKQGYLQHLLSLYLWKKVYVSVILALSFKCYSG